MLSACQCCDRNLICIPPATYNASKAALIIAGEGWRLELAPLGVRVMTLITGGITTKFLTKLEPVALPEDSYYMSIVDIIATHPESVPLGVDPKAFALDIVRRVEKGSKGKQWVGGGSSIAYWAALFFPQWALVSDRAALCCDRYELLTLGLQDQVVYMMKPFTKKLSEAHAKRMNSDAKK